jgi:ABC-2 type transport system permease protein
MKGIQKHWRQFSLVLIGLVLLNVFGSYFFKRFDLTQDKRYTLSTSAKNTVATVNAPIIIDVFLKGNFPPEFNRLQSEVKQLLDEFKAYNPNIQYEFINPLEDEERPEEIQKQLAQLGLTTAQVEVRENGKLSTELIYPWALAYHNEKTVKIPLLKNQLGTTTEDRVNNSIQNLEYAFADGFNKLVNSKKKKVAVLKGNGELEDRYIADLFRSLREYYHIAPYTLDSISANPRKTLNDLKEFDLIVVAQPTQAFNDAEKYILDQYIMNGGASLWLVDATQMQTDPLSGKSYVVKQDLNLNDIFFKYGIRINQNLIKDLYSAPIVLTSGTGSESQYNKYHWFYQPLSASSNNHPIVTNIEVVKFEYVSTLDTLPNDLKKTVLLSSSPITQIVGLPKEINFDVEIPENMKIVNEGPDLNQFSAGEMPIAVLLEGKFSSAFTNRVKPYSWDEDKTLSWPTKMVVISDGNVIVNQFDKKRPLELGFDKFTNTFYGNKDFLLNTVNYLLDDSGLINIRSKEIAIAFLDPIKVDEQRTLWQWINLILPLGLLTIFGFSFAYYRKRKYAR